MRTTILIAVLLFANKCFSQNLIPNGSFEDVNICSEFDAPCAPAAWKTTSPLLPKYLENDSNNKYVGITVFNTSSQNIRQYLQVQLLCPLIKDKLYRFSIKVKPEKAIIESFGILFSDSSMFFEKDELIKSKPNIELNQIYFSIPKKKRKDWVKIEAEYRANGNERFIIIGNFQTDSEQKKVFLFQSKQFTDYFYSIDDVCLYSKDSIIRCPEYVTTQARLYNLRERHTLNKHNMFTEIRKPIEFINESKVDTIRLSSIFFEFNSSSFDTIQKLQLDSLLRKISKENIESIEIIGSTDSIEQNL